MGVTTKSLSQPSILIPAFLHPPFLWHRALASSLHNDGTGLIGDLGVIAKKLKQAVWSILPRLPDPLFLYVRHCLTFKRLANPWRPKRFNEHMLRLMNGRRDNRRRVFADKLATRDYVESRIGTGYLPELYLESDDPSRINFDALPQQFVIKGAHGSNMNQIVLDKSKLDTDALRRRMAEWMATDYGRDKHEYVYQGLPRRILAERLLEFGPGKLCYDYKFFCFRGVTQMIHVIVDRSTTDQFARTHAFFDPDWQPIDMTWGADLTTQVIERPACFDEMKDLAHKLSHDFDFLRVDFYVLEGRPIVGELTNFSDGGNARIHPPERDLWLGAFFDA